MDGGFWEFRTAYGHLEEPKRRCHITLYWGWFEMAGAGLGWDGGAGWAGHRNLDTGHNLHIYGDQRQPAPAWTPQLLVIASLVSRSPASSYPSGQPRQCSVRCPYFHMKWPLLLSVSSTDYGPVPRVQQQRQGGDRVNNLNCITGQFLPTLSQTLSVSILALESNAAFSLVSAVQSVDGRYRRRAMHLC